MANQNKGYVETHLELGRLVADPDIAKKVERIEEWLKEKFPTGTVGDYKHYVESVMEQMRGEYATPLEKLDKLYVFTDIHMAQERLDKERDKIRFRMEALRHADN